jgi:hypothetical protein
MDIKRIYQRVVMGGANIEELDFFMYFNDTVNSLRSKFKDKYVVLPGNTYVPIDDLEDTAAIYDLYFECIVDNIIYIATNNAERKIDFENKAQQAYLAVWSETSHGRSVKERLPPYVYKRHNR